MPSDRLLQIRSLTWEVLMQNAIVHFLFSPLPLHPNPCRLERRGRGPKSLFTTRKLTWPPLTSSALPSPAPSPMSPTARLPRQSQQDLSRLPASPLLTLSSSLQMEPRSVELASVRRGKAFLVNASSKLVSSLVTLFSRFFAKNTEREQEWWDTPSLSQTHRTRDRS